MNKNTAVLSFLLLSCSSWAANFSIETKPSLGKITDFKASELCQVAENTKHYLTKQKSDHFAVHAGSVFEQNSQISLDRVKQTLAFICQTYREDVRAQRQSRLHEKDFLTAHFDFVRWLPDKQTANKIANKSTNSVKNRLLTNIPPDQLFLTKYYTKLLSASAVKTEKYNQALYAIPNDEQSLTLEQAEQKKAALTRFKYTRQQVIDGALLSSNLAKPLVWLTEEALHDVLLQGTGVLNIKGEIRYFNVHRNNGIAYNYSIGKREQARYWYFAEVPSVMGYGKTLATKIAITPQVTLAGNVAELGLGKLLMLSYSVTGLDNKNQQVSRMAVLADQGGAFDNNLFQLDLLVDSYQGWQDYYQANKHLPDYAKVWLMLVKQP
jgi:membrane-bound lytic murein transglycosylase